MHTAIEHLSDIHDYQRFGEQANYAFFWDNSLVFPDSLL